MLKLREGTRNKEKRMIMILNGGSDLLYGGRGGPARLALQRPSQFKIQDKYSEVEDPRLCTFS